MSIALVIVLGVLAGVVSGMLGVGGGVLFVPALALVVGLSQVDAEATSLLAIIPVAFIGAWRQHGYGNVRVREGVLVGVLAIAGVVPGVALANVLPERVLEALFAALALFVAAQMVRRAFAPADRSDSATNAER